MGSRAFGSNGFRIHFIFPILGIASHLVFKYLRRQKIRSSAEPISDQLKGANMSKVLFSAQNGALQITENGGVVTLSINESLGGGATAGVVQGTASIQLGAMQALQAGEKLLNAHLPASVASLAPAIEAVVNTAVAALE